MRALGGQGRALGHAKAVLLVGYHQGKVFELDVFRQQRVRPHAELALPAGEGGEHLALFPGRHGPGELAHLYAEWREEAR